MGAWGGGKWGRGKRLKGGCDMVCVVISCVWIVLLVFVNMCIDDVIMNEKEDHWVHHLAVTYNNIKNHVKKT